MALLLLKRSVWSPDLVPITAAVIASDTEEAPSWARQGGHTVTVHCLGERTHACPGCQIGVRGEGDTEGGYCLGEGGSGGPRRGGGEGEELRGGEAR